MTEVISCSLDLEAPIRCPDFDPKKSCRKTKCRFWEFCKACQGEYGADET